MKKKAIYVLSVIPVVLIVSFFIYTSNYYKASDNAVAALSSSDSVIYENDEWIEYTPVNYDNEKALILYPGGKVESEAYAPLAKEIAENGIKVIIVDMPFKLAVFGVNKADDVIENHDDIKEWYIAGHSLGGVMAASYAYDHQDTVEGLILLASYTQQKKDLSESDISVLSLYGSLDGFVSSDTIDEGKAYFPSDTTYISIEGGNHSQMGDYGFQKGDNDATISREEQLAILVVEICNIINY